MSNQNYFRPLLLSFLALCLMSMGVFKRMHPKDRSKVQHYKAIKYWEQGNEKKAIKKLKKAISIYRDNEYLLDLATIYSGMGENEKAFKYVSMVKNKDATPLEQITLCAWKAIYAMNNDVNDKPHQLNGTALDLMIRYHEIIDSTELHSLLFNNRGVTRLFYQSEPSKKKTELIHVRDFEQSQAILKKALEKDPDNCVAQYNLAVVETVLNGVQIDSVERKYGYIDSSWYMSLQFPEFDCPLPHLEKHLSILEKLNREEEVLFLLDISGSMSETMESGQTRFESMKALVKDLIAGIDPEVDLGILTLGQGCSETPIIDLPVGTMPRGELIKAVDNLTLDGATPLNMRLKMTPSRFTGNKTGKSVFLCSDGINTCGVDESTCAIADELAQEGIKVHALSLLLEDRKTMQEFAIYDCITKATMGEMLGIAEHHSQLEVKTQFISRDVYPLVLKPEDLAKSEYTPIIPKAAEDGSMQLSNKSK